MDQIWFTGLSVRSPVDGHLVCFYFLLIVNHAVMSILLQAFYMLLFLLRRYLGVKLLGHVVTPRLTFLKNSHIRFQMFIDSSISFSAVRPPSGEVSTWFILKTTSGTEEILYKCLLT